MTAVTEASTWVHPPPSPWAIETGANLREAREACGLSLAAVEKESGGEWMEARVGSYERGVRAVTVETLAGLARFYGVRLTDLLPEDDRPPLVAAAFTAITASAAGAVRQQLLDRALREGGDDLYLAIRGFLEVAS